MQKTFSDRQRLKELLNSASAPQEIFYKKFFRPKENDIRWKPGSDQRNEEYWKW